MNLSPVSPFSQINTAISQSSYVTLNGLFSSKADSFDKNPMSIIKPEYRKVAEHRSTYKEINHQAIKAFAAIIERMETTFTTPNGKPDTEAIKQLIDICADEHYGKYISIWTNKLLSEAIKWKKEKGAKTQTVLEMFELFHHKDALNDYNNLLNNNNFDKGYRKLFEKLPDYIDENGDFDRKKFIKDTFSTLACEYSEFLHSDSFDD